MSLLVFQNARKIGILLGPWSVKGRVIANLQVKSRIFGWVNSFATTSRKAQTHWIASLEGFTVYGHMSRLSKQEQLFSLITDDHGFTHQACMRQSLSYIKTIRILSLTIHTCLDAFQAPTCTFWLIAALWTQPGAEIR